MRTEALATITNNYANLFKGPTQVLWGVVKSVEGSTCTIQFTHCDLIVDGVSLSTDEEANGGLLLTPRIGSLVLVGRVENLIQNLYVCQYSEIERAELTIGNSLLIVSDEEVTLRQNNTMLSLKDGKVKLQNQTVDLGDLLGTLAKLIKGIKVLCGPAGSLSTTVDPATLSGVTQLESQINQLLS